MFVLLQFIGGYSVVSATPARMRKLLNVQNRPVRGEFIVKNYALKVIPLSQPEESFSGRTRNRYDRRLPICSRWLELLRAVPRF